MNWPGFANPWMLAGLAALGLPVLIHLLTRARPRRITFPPFKFLVEACAGQQAIHRLRTYILLALRTLAVLAVVLLFARPFLSPKDAGNVPGAERRAVLVLDASLSMKAVQGGVSLFARAQSEAAEVLRSLEAGSEAAVVLLGATPRALLPALSRNIPALHAGLVGATATFEKGDPAAALALASRLLGGAGTIHVFSDFQNSNWEPARDLPAGVVCRLRPVNAAPVENVAIVASSVAPMEPVAGEPAEVIVTVFNGTSRARQENVRLELGDFNQEARVTVPPFGKADAAFEVTFSQPGPLSGQASLAPDDLREDNTRHLAINVAKALQLLLISDAEPADTRSAAFFIERALMPSTNASSIAVVRRHSQDADRGMLETADVFVLAPPAIISGEALEIIERRVRDGARFIAFLDGPTSPFLVPAAFAPPFQLRRAIQSGTGDRIVAGPRKLFPEADPGELSRIGFTRHYENQVLAGREDDVMYRYHDGSAALTMSAVGKGAAVFANLPLTPDGGAFIGHPMFPATLHEILRALRRGAGSHDVAPGVAWTIDAPTVGEAAVTITGPDGKPVPSQVVASGRLTRLALAPATTPGTYLLHQGNHLISTAVINVDPLESDTRPIALENLKPGSGSVASIVRNESDLQLTGQTRPLWPQLTGIVALLLALEMLLLALWRHSRSSGTAAALPANFLAGEELAPMVAPVTADRHRPAREEVLR
jgi:hypothetical protein